MHETVDLESIPTLVLDLRHARCGWRGPVVLDRWTELRRGRLHGEGTCPYCLDPVTPWVWRRTVEAQGITLVQNSRGIWDARRGGAWMIGHTRTEALRELLTMLPERHTRTVRGRPL
jgi:hypothetical protein